MSDLDSIQKAIDYIEDNLDGNLSIEKLSRESGYSVPHFYRIFGASTGCSVKEYVQNRRLSNAVYRLRTTKQSIIDIALDSGYHSHEAFSRAVKTKYQQSPMEIRNSPFEPVLFEKLNISTLLMKKGEIKMEVKIVCKDELKLVGISREVNQGNQLKNNVIQHIQSELESRVNDINSRQETGVYFAAYDYNLSDLSKDDEDINYVYYYCVAVSEFDNVPNDMVTKVIKSTKYAVFTYDLQKDTLNGEQINMAVYDYIDGIWLINSGVELSEQSDFERIDREKNVIDYFISVK